MSAATPATSAWAPLRVTVFRSLWLAMLVSNTGTWMQMVGAQWLLVNQPHASILVALVQAADMLPDLLFSSVGGVLADTFDRRRLLITVQACLFVTAVALTILTIAGEMPPALLLIFTFLLGAGSAFVVPPYQALIPDIVPRNQLPAASGLGSMSINLARAVGPAIAGVLIARAGVAAVFALNAATYLIFGLVVAAWRPPSEATSPSSEPFVAALQAGGRYVNNSPVVRRILLRSALFLLPASALWALLPLVASQHLGLGAEGYGVLLAALGIGAIVGALILPQIRAKVSNNTLMTAASLVYAVTLVAVILGKNAGFTVAMLFFAGIAWIAVLSTIGAELQLFLPAWVRARGLSVYQTVLFGVQAAGAVVWGFMASLVGLPPAFLAAGAVMLAGAATIRLWPLIDTSSIDSSLAVYWPEPQLVLEPGAESGPVVVHTVYTIAPESEGRFLQAMSRVRRSRLRTGATRWGLFRDGEHAHQFVELFVVPSWEEHLRQHSDRLTGIDRQFDEEASSLSDPPPVTSHLIAADIQRAPSSAS